ncbi:MAG: hypothetical protein M1832_002831 [Thelocarpon impressellum]|nr:MAG: hypothetical protein M1832_002831 [Thelocarpon impressellum]
MSNRFYFGASSNSSPPSTSRSSSSDDLPYPTPLPRSSFLTADFSPTTYLSTLRNRHQTLEDLRGELRTRSQDLSRELLDLVNANYEDFLHLGGSLKGGDERVEEVRVGLLGFTRDLRVVRRAVAEREAEVGGLLAEKAELRARVAVGRGLLEVVGRLEELEEKLMVESDGAKGVAEDPDSSDTDSSSDEASATAGFVSTRKLHQHVQAFLLLRHLISALGPEHPFLLAQDARMIRVRNTLLLDLGTALKQARTAGEAGADRTIKVLGIYRDLGEAGQAVAILREGRR